MLTLDPQLANELGGIDALFGIVGAILLARALVWVKAGGIAKQSDLSPNVPPLIGRVLGQNFAVQ